MNSEFSAQCDAYLHAHPDTETVDFLVVDLNGVCRGKRAPVGALSKLAQGEMVFPRGTTLLDTLGRAAETLPWGVVDGDPDRPVGPVLGSLSPAPGGSGREAQVLVFPQERDGSAWFACPRQVLQRQLDALERAGLVATVAVELEFYLFETRGDTSFEAAKGTSGMPPFSGPQTYNLDQLDDHREFLDDVLRACEASAVPATSVLSEYGNGQFEINLKHLSDPMLAADHAVLMRRIVKRVAARHGLLATFMAKPLAADSGNGLHVHLSLHKRDGSAVFGGTSEAPGEALQYAVSGLLQTLAPSMALLAPNANSWRRFDSGFYAPTTATWGINHRQVALRVPFSDDANLRIEHRVAGADANPYLVLAALLAGAQLGLDGSTLPPEPVADGARLTLGEPLPIRWREALLALAAASDFKARLGEAFVDAYVGMKREEEEVFHAQVSNIDIEHYIRTL